MTWTRARDLFDDRTEFFRVEVRPRDDQDAWDIVLHAARPGGPRRPSDASGMTTSLLRMNHGMHRGI